MNLIWDDSIVSSHFFVRQSSSILRKLMEQARLAIVEEVVPGLASAGNHFDILLHFFLDEKDVCESSRMTSYWSLTRYFKWVETSGRMLNAMTPADIISYKDYLLRTAILNNQGVLLNQASPVNP